MDLPDQVFDAEHKNVLAIIVVSFTAVMPQRNDYWASKEEIHQYASRTHKDIARADPAGTSFAVERINHHGPNFFLLIFLLNKCVMSK